MPADEPRTVQEWAGDLGVAPNTLKNWISKHGLASEVVKGVHLLRGSVVRRFVEANPQLPAARAALRRLGRDDGLRQRSSTGVSDVDPAPSDRDAVRALRATVAALDQQLDEARAENTSLRTERDMWRDRAAAHRESLRRQLDLEEGMHEHPPSR